MASPLCVQAFSPSRLQYITRVWQEESGLPHNSVLALAQTREGYLWVGTKSGLARFNGMSFTRPAANQTNLNNSAITVLREDQESTLWIGTTDGLYRFKGGEFARQNLGNEPRINCIMSLCADGNGLLWIGTMGGLLRYAPGTALTRWTTKDGLPDDTVRGIRRRDEELWIATGRGLASLQKGKLLVHPLERIYGVKTVLPMGRDAVWVGTEQGLVRLENGQEKRYSTGEGLADLNITTLYEDRQGNLWIGTGGGLQRLADGQIISEKDSDSAVFDNVTCVLQDREGSIWVGGKDGLYQLRVKAFEKFTRREGLSHNNVVSVLEDSNNDIWVGTWGGGLNRLRGENTRAYSARAQLGVAGGDLLLGLFEDRDHALWVGTDYRGGLFRFEEGKFTLGCGAENGLTDVAIRVVHRDRKGRLLLGSNSGLSVIEANRLAHYSVENGLPGKAVLALLEDHTGNIWIGTDSGLACQRASCSNEQTFICFTRSNGLSYPLVSSLCEDEQHQLWIGTRGGGIYRFKGERLVSYTQKQGLFSDEIFEILEDDQGCLWASCPKGIFRASKKEFDDMDEGRIRSLRCTVYGRDDGMSTLQCSGVAKPSAWKSRDGRLWFATAQGLVVTDPKMDFKKNEIPPLISIEEVLADKCKIQDGEWKIESGSEANLPSSLLHPSSALQIPAGRGALEFHYASLSFIAPEKNFFRYKLEGVDSEWVEAGARRAAYYNNILPGHYRFQVTGCNNDGVWNNNGATLSIVVQPHFWQTAWFSGSLVLLALAGVAGATRYVTWKRVQMKLRQLEQQHALETERARIAKDIHDDLGAALTQITLLSDLAQRESQEPRVTAHAAQISATARELVQSMDEIVWAVNPRNDNLPRLAGYIFRFAEKFFAGTAIRCRFDSPEDLPERPLRADVRHHLFLTVKEALNNAAKHAAATEVWLRLTVENSQLSISIEDNGQGFSSGETRAFGNGLLNMRKRLEEIGGQFELTSAPGEGTKIKLKLPLKT